MNKCRALARELVEEGVQDVDVYQDGPYTFVLVQTMVDGRRYTGFGFAKCNPGDEFSEDRGEEIAFGRAVMMVVGQLDGSIELDQDECEETTAQFVGPVIGHAHSGGTPAPAFIDWKLVQRQVAEAMQASYDGMILRALIGDGPQVRVGSAAKRPAASDPGQSVRVAYQPGLFTGGRIFVVRD